MLAIHYLLKQQQCIRFAMRAFMKNGAFLYPTELVHLLELVH